jgi:hypothetical protein
MTTGRRWSCILDIEPTLGLAIGAAAILLALDGLGWRLTSRLFDQERLITGR